MKDPYKSVRRVTPKPGFKFGTNKYRRDNYSVQQMIEEEVNNLNEKEKKKMRTYYYYYRDQFKRTPLVTVCLMTTKNHAARGISICSPLDVCCKDTGRRLARGKALRALGTKKNSSKIGRRTRVLEVLNWANVPAVFIFKSEIDPTLTEFEYKLLRK